MITTAFEATQRRKQLESIRQSVTLISDLVTGRGAFIHPAVWNALDRLVQTQEDEIKAYEAALPAAPVSLDPVSPDAGPPPASGPERDGPPRLGMEERLDRLRALGYESASYHCDHSLVWVGCYFLKEDVVDRLIRGMEARKITHKAITTATLAVLSGFPYEGDERTTESALADLEDH